MFELNTRLIENSYGTKIDAIDTRYKPHRIQCLVTKGEQFHFKFAGIYVDTMRFPRVISVFLESSVVLLGVLFINPPHLGDRMGTSSL